MDNLKKLLELKKDNLEQLNSFTDVMKGINTEQFAELMKIWMKVHVNDENLSAGQVEYIFDTPIYMYYSQNKKITREEFFENKKEAYRKNYFVNSVVREILERIVNNNRCKVSRNTRRKVIQEIFTEEEIVTQKSYAISSYLQSFRDSFRL